MQFWIIVDTKPETPVWIPSGIRILSTSSIQLQFNDSSVGGSVIYTLFRDGVVSTDPENNGTAKIMTEDTGLQAGTVYQYYVVAYSNGDTSVPSEVLTICTNPDPPLLAFYSTRQADRFDLEWSRPSTGTATGFYFNDTTFGYFNQNTTNNSFTITGLKALEEYEMNVTLQSYLLCYISFEMPNPRELLSDSTYTESIKIPVYLTVPVWLPDQCQPISSTSMYLEFNHTLQDPAVTYILYRDGILSSDPDNNGTDKFITDDTGLQPGTVYTYTVVATTNGELSNQSDILQICTNPGMPTSIGVTNRLPNSAELMWNNPATGSVSGFYFNDTMGNSNLKTQVSNLTYSGLNASESYEVNVSVSTYLECNVTVGATTLELRELWSDSSYEIALTIPPYLTVPVWIIPLSQTLSSSSIYLVFNDTSPINNTIITYTLFRDGVLSVDSENNGTSLSITDDTGLQAGTVYEYEVMANVNGETTERSDKLQICTNPDPPQLAMHENRIASSMDITWTAPSAGSVSGYYLSDNLGNNYVKLNQSKYSYGSLSAVESYQLNISLQSYLECNVSGESIPRELLSDVVYNISLEIPQYLEAPHWLPALSLTLSSSAIYLEWNASTNPLGTIYTVYRDSVPLSDSENNSTNTSFTDDNGLQPGTMYQYTVTATLGGETTSQSEVLEICTNPDPPSSLALENRTINGAVIKWSAPGVGSVSGYYIGDDRGNSNLKVTSPSNSYNSLDASQSYQLNVSLQSYLECNVTGESTTRELLIGVIYNDSLLIPEYLSMPVWMPTLSTTVSSTAIYLQFNDSNPLGTTYTIFRDGIVSPDGDNNSTYNFMTDDTGLQPGSVYNYTVVAFIGQESTAESDVMQICTAPDIPQMVAFESRTEQEASFVITGPTVGSTSGYYLTDNMGNSFTKISQANFSYHSLSAIQSYQVNITLRSFLECNVTGDPQQRELPSDASYNVSLTIPEYMTQPVWISSLSVTLSSTSIYLQFNDSNPVGATYTLYRDSIPLSDSENNSTNKFITDDTGLQPGTVYQYTVTASFGGQTTGHSSVLEICTEPAEPISAAVDGRTINGFVVKWSVPVVGAVTGYYMNDNMGNTNTKILDNFVNYTSLSAVQSYTVNISLNSYLECNVTGEPTPRELISSSAYNDSLLVPEYLSTPVWLPSLSLSVSSSSIYLQLNDSNPTGTVYTILRGGVVLSDSDNNSTNKFINDDTGLQPGTVYRYTVVASVGSETTPVSSELQICTNPDPPGSALLSTRLANSASIIWTAPSTGSLSGFRISDNLGNSNVNVAISSISYMSLSAVVSYQLEVSLQTYLECNVTGDPTTRQLISDNYNTTINIPQYLFTPNWLPALSFTLSSSSIYLEWNASTNPLGTIYTVYRDSIPLIDSESNSTNTSLTDDNGLQPGTMYQYTVTATLGGETAPVSSILEICSEPIAPSSVSYQNRQSTSVELQWTAPSIGSATGYYFSDNRGNIGTKTQQQFFTYGGLSANQDYVINITIHSYLDCDVTGDPVTRELLSTNELNATVFVSREGNAVVPLWMPSLSHSQSSTSVYLEFTDPSPTATPATVYTVSRNGAAVTSPNNNVALMTSFVDDDNGGGLDPGQTYEYTVTATDSDGSQRESNVMNMCTNPDVPSALQITAESSDSFQLTWNAPQVGSVSGYYLTDSMLHSNMRIIPNQFTLVYYFRKLCVSIFLQSISHLEASSL
ncbi:fibronectin-like [Convolutriloba macropyga]|uniref:fibronectin-like n=1 Tax=Convolutriloba macropyga TaxID=536237 RepID=UPI003F524CCE